MTRPHDDARSPDLAAALLLERRDFVARDLARSHPPRLRHANKKIVHELACPPGSALEGAIGYSRWRAGPLPEVLPPRAPAVEAREDAFGYEPEPPPTVAWYVNFADPNLFFAYAGGLLAQDELQVAEHPALASVREALVASGLLAVTEELGRATPVLVTGVERRCAIATKVLYGNRFAAAAPELVRRSVKVLSPPTITNVLAIAAPSHGRGVYKRGEIERVLETAHAGFLAARLESARVAGRAGANRDDPAPVTIHTGFWGCGAFGGNRVLMAALQLVAAHLAGVDRVVFHAFDAAGSEAFAAARAIDALELAWGEGDGT